MSSSPNCYKSSCAGCARSEGLDNVEGGIIPLQGGWIVNQYAGPEGYLGWLALQPRYHRMSLSELNADELIELGPNLRHVDLALEDYWRETFPSDPVKRVYVVYFFESIYDVPPTSFHLHLHIIPRFESLDPLLRGASGIDAWKIPTISEKDSFPPAYPSNAANVGALMTWLRNRL